MNINQRLKIYQICKKLNVPAEIRKTIYNNRLTGFNFFKYNLANKIPLSCLLEKDRKIIAKFGIEKTRMLDWELLNDPYFKNWLLDLDASTIDLNTSLYNEAKKRLSPKHYSSKMKETCQECYCEILDTDSIDVKSLKESFNNGSLTIESVISNWPLLKAIFKDKDLKYFLKSKFSFDNDDYANSDRFKKIMNNHGAILKFLNKYLHDKNDSTLSNLILKTEEEQKSYIRENLYTILWYYNLQDITNEEYREIFKYLSFKECFNYPSHYNQLATEIEKLPEDYIFKMPFPIRLFKDYNIGEFLGKYGLKNVIDFDNECNHFFTKDNCYVLKNIGLQFSNVLDHLNFVRKSSFPQWTKEEFYKLMRCILQSSPKPYFQEPLINIVPYYKAITGKFREENEDLFLPENAPEKLQEAFYSHKIITSQILEEHPEYISYLKDKNMAACGKKYEDLCQEIKSLKYGQEALELYNFYEQMVYEFHDRYFYVNYLSFKFEITKEDLLKEIEKALILQLRYERNYAFRIYSQKYAPLSFKKDHPELFLSEDAPDGLQEAYYNRNLIDIIHSHPEYLEYLKNIDFELLWGCPFISLNFSFPNQVIYFETIKQQYGSEALNFMYICGSFIKNLKCPSNWDDSLKNMELLNALEVLIAQGIIEKKINDYKNMPKSFKEKYPNLFLSEDAPKELQEIFYNRKMDLNFIYSHPNYWEYLKGIDFRILFGYMPINISENEIVNFVEILQRYLGTKEDFSLMVMYVRYMKTIYEANGLRDFKYNPNLNKNDFLNEMDATLRQAIIEGCIINYEDLPTSFKEKYPNLFLSEDAPEELKKAFYYKRINLGIILNNPDYLKYLERVDIAIGWIDNLFANSSHKEDYIPKLRILIDNYNNYKLLDSFSQALFKDFCCTQEKQIIELLITNNIEEFKEKLNKLIQIFALANIKNTEMNKTTLNNIVLSFLQRRYRLEHLEVLAIFPRILQIIDHANRTKLIEMLNLINEEVNIEEILATINDKITFAQFVDALLQKDETAINLLHTLTNNYILNKRNEYIKAHLDETFHQLKGVHYELDRKKVLQYILRKMSTEEIIKFFPPSTIIETTLAEYKFLNNRDLIEKIINLKKKLINGEKLNESERRILNDNNRLFNNVFIKYTPLFSKETLGLSQEEEIPEVIRFDNPNRNFIINVLRNLNIGILDKGVFADKENGKQKFEELIKILKSFKILGWGSIFEKLSLECGISYDEEIIANLISYFGVAYDTIKEKNFQLNLTRLLDLAYVFGTMSEKYVILLGKEDFSLIASNPIPNASSLVKEERIKKALVLLKEIRQRKIVSIPPLDQDFSLNNGKKINIVVGNTSNMINLTYGERTGACMRIGGVGNSLFEYCLKDKHGFHIRFTNPETGKFVSRVSGFRNGNTIFLNELRHSCDEENYGDSELVEACQMVAKELIELSKNARLSSNDTFLPIDNVVISPWFAMEPNKNLVQDLGVADVTKGLSPFYHDVSSLAIILATSSPNNKLVPIVLEDEVSKIPEYETIRDKINILYDQKASWFMQHLWALDCYLKGMDIEDIKPLDNDKILICYCGEDWYVALDTNFNIHKFIMESSNDKEKASQEAKQAEIILKEIKTKGLVEEGGKKL